MEYIINGITIKLELDENQIENIISDFEDNLEHYEEITISNQCNEIRIDAFNITNGDYRYISSIDPNEYTYCTVYKE